jgi:hypothetical protein
MNRLKIHSVGKVHSVQADLVEVRDLQALKASQTSLGSNKDPGELHPLATYLMSLRRCSAVRVPADNQLRVKVKTS